MLVKRICNTINVDIKLGHFKHKSVILQSYSISIIYAFCNICLDWSSLKYSSGAPSNANNKITSYPCSAWVCCRRKKMRHIVLRETRIVAGQERYLYNV